MKYLFFINPRVLFRLPISALVLLFCVTFSQANAQVNVTGGYTASQMAAKLAGPGVSVFGATLTCPTDASGEFVVVSSTLGMDSGIVLTCGTAVTTATTVGVNIINGDTAGAVPGNFASTNNLGSSTGGVGDTELSVLAGQATFDACVLEFNFKPAGDTIRFKYVFGSEEYTGYTCSTFNDVFGFFISGGAYTTSTNIAKVPGTNIPVCINSVNCGATGGYPLSNCTSLGTGSPFCAYYVANGTGTTITYDGLTVPLYAIARVNPCDTYHLKLGVADASDHVLDSGVFLEAGSLTSDLDVNVSAIGLGGSPDCVRGCLPATFVFTTGVAQDTPIVARFVIGGTAVNGYDYSFIPDSIIIPAFTSSTSISINPLLVSASGTKTVIVSIMIPDPCHPGVFVLGATATINILDSFTMNIITPDTAICRGEIVNAVATGDPIFGSLLTYAWTPSAAVGAGATTLTPTLTPTATTTYTLTAVLTGTTGCPPKTRDVTVTVYSPTFDSVTFTNPTVCGYTDGKMILHGLQVGFLDTLHYSFNGTPQPPLPIGVSSSGRATVSGLGSGVYSNIWVKVGLCPTVTRGPITLVDPAPPTVSVDSHYVKTCVGQSTLLHAYVSSTGIPIYYTWSPAAYLSSTTAASTIVSPSIGGDITYTVTVNPGTNPACASFDTIHVHTLDLTVLNNRDTVICIGNYVQASVTGSSEYAYAWTPTTGVSAPATQNPTITPPVTQSYSVTASYANCPDQVHHFNIEVDTPAIPRNIIDTICIGMSDSFDFRVPGTAGTTAYTYTWSTATMSDISNPAIGNPIITPAAIGTNYYSVNIHPAALNCATNSSVTIFVIDTTISISPTDTFICRGKVVQAVGTGDPLFSYQWLPTAGIAVSNVFNALITPDTSALYVVTATFGRCPPIHRTLQLEVEPNPTVYIGGNRFLCAFDTLHLDASINPGWYSKYKYSWTPAADLDNTTSGTVVYSGTTSTKLYLTVTTDSAGCTAKDSAQITVYPGNFASITPDHYNYCPHDTTAIAVTTTAGAGVTYRWYPSRDLDDSTSPSPKLKPVGNQVYTIVATTSNGCTDTLNFSASVYPGALISIPDSVTLYPGESYHIMPLTNCTSFLWFPPAGLSGTNISDPIATPDVSTKYYVFGVTSDGCKSMDSIDVNVEPEALLVLPNAFNPGTGVNKEFKIIKRGIATLNYFRIFNRWGNLLYETKDIDKGWDGTFNGEPQPLGVYVYDIQAITSSGRIFNKTGNVTIIR